jgi:hypothetical protein
LIELLFGDFNDRGFPGLEMAFGVTKLFAEVAEFVVGVLLDFGEFGVDDFDRLGFGGDVGVLGLEIVDESF